eukprot:CAMPEP_0184547538 /NCGR_PEP_ID=MMETSP0199_2-20130426/5633_1 /TAXON_ID=1112570 /ORGANISM="Thraustochytrium sp., Strain LLF1b" /LENGTH=508 /DNA_ID=CAMNT_0026942045 /DNA_START=50 /DNA_END=1579 /DNA_ORIENTATION=+
MAMTDDGSRAMQREVELDGGAVLSNTLGVEEVFETRKTAELAAEHGFARIALQMPDELIPLAWELVTSIKRELVRVGAEADVFVLGDTSFGSCCVDDVAGQHYNADLIVHYGVSCLSEPSRTPVHFVFGRLELEVEAAAQAIANALSDTTKTVMLFRDVRLDYATDALVKALKAQGVENVVAPHLRGGFQPSQPKDQPLEEQILERGTVLGHQVEWPETDPEHDQPEIAIVYIGSEGPHVAQVALKWGHLASQVLLYDNNTARVVDASSRGSALLRKRFVKIQHAKDAQIYGLLVGTMGVRGYEKVLAHLTKMIADAGKKSYTFLMGKINPNKLANFASTVDAYVLVACPLNSLLDSKEVFTPVVTPLELEIALGLREWSGTDYSCHFGDLNFEASVDENADSDNEAPHFSTLTGGFVHNTTRGKHGSEDAHAARDLPAGSDSSGAVSTSKGAHVTLRYSSPAGELLAKQTFQGLETNKGDKVATAARDGQTGTASGLAQIGEFETLR